MHKTSLGRLAWLSSQELTRTEETMRREDEAKPFSVRCPGSYSSKDNLAGDPPPPLPRRVPDRGNQPWPTL